MKHPNSSNGIETPEIEKYSEFVESNIYISSSQTVDLCP
jgi:hypothetical protein